jgi:hypothetical protein
MAATVPGRSLVYVRLFPIKSTRYTPGFAGVDPDGEGLPAQPAIPPRRTRVTKARCKP